MGSPDTRLETNPTPFWQPRYYDRNVRDEREFAVKLQYLHRNPVKRELAGNPTDWHGSSFRHCALRELDRIRMDRRRQRDQLKGWTRADILDPRLAPKEQANLG